MRRVLSRHVGRGRPVAAVVAAVAAGVVAGVVMSAAMVGSVSVVRAQDVEPPASPGTVPLIPVPVGCSAPRPAHIVFTGTVVDRDFRTIRYEIERVRAGRTDPFAAGSLIDVRYGLDAQYIDDEGEYLVSAVVDPDLGILVSRVTEPVENFGGDEVIGVSETDVNCPEFEDPMRTLHLDGTPIDGGVIAPFLDAKPQLLGAILVPVLVAFGIIFLLAMFRLSLAGLFHSLVRSSGR